MEKDRKTINDNTKENDFYKYLVWILIFIIFVLGLILYYILKRFKVINRKNLNYQQFS